MIMYKSDSIVVGVAIGHKDSSMTELELQDIISQELPDFEVEKSARKSKTTHRLGNNALLILNSKSEKNTFPLTGMVIMTDPRIIPAWTRNITEWKKE